jgi:Avidin family
MASQAGWPLEGAWYNELGSTMVIDPLGPDGQTVTGSYTSGVSTSGCARGAFPLVGRSDVQAGGRTIGWTVCWLNDDSKCWSTTSWAGQHQLFDGEATIHALWLLTMQVDPDEEWASTLIGHDVFTRKRPTDEEVAQALKLKRHPHP